MIFKRILQTVTIDSESLQNMIRELHSEIDEKIVLLETHQILNNELQCIELKNEIIERKIALSILRAKLGF